MFRVFLDASVLLASAGSQHGGSSSAINRLLGSEEYEAITSREVEREARGNLGRKFDQLARIRFDARQGELMPTYVDPGATPLPPDLPASAAAKDHHVIAACLAAGAAICLTLDRRHLLSEDVRQWGLRHGIRFLTPGEFLEWDRLEHEGQASDAE